MKNLVLILTMLFTSFAFAGFQGYQSTTDLGLFTAVKCSTGLTCTKKAEKLQLTATTQGLLQTQSQSITSGAITVAQCGTTFFNSGAIQLNLPVASGAFGCRFTFVTATANNFDINPSNLDQIKALTLNGGGAIRNATVGNSITIESVQQAVASGGYLWSPVGIYGTWTDIN